MSVDARCQCSRYPDVPCESAITQEDLLCDGCRMVCNDMIFAFIVYSCIALARGWWPW